MRWVAAMRWVPENGREWRVVTRGVTAIGDWARPFGASHTRCWSGSMSMWQRLALACLAVALWQRWTRRIKSPKAADRRSSCSAPAARRCSANVPAAGTQRTAVETGAGETKAHRKAHRSAPASALLTTSAARATAHSTTWTLSMTRRALPALQMNRRALAAAVVTPPTRCAPRSRLPCSSCTTPGGWTWTSCRPALQTGWHRHACERAPQVSGCGRPARGSGGGAPGRGDLRLSATFIDLRCSALPLLLPSDCSGRFAGDVASPG